MINLNIKSINKEQFLRLIYLNDSLSEELLIKFNEIPETIIYNNSEYKIQIIVEIIVVDNQSYLNRYSLNFYSEEIKKRLFSYHESNKLNKIIEEFISNYRDLK